MLKIVGSLDLTQGHLVIDGDVPFSFRVYDDPLTAPHIWFIGNLNTSLLLDKAQVAKRCYRADRAGFFEGNNGELCGIGFYDLNAAELAEV
jgi:hypothetical protein